MWRGRLRWCCSPWRCPPPRSDRSRCPRISRASASPSTSGARLPLDLEFKDEDGVPVRLGRYFTGDRPVILTLGYYRCPMLCTLVLNSLVDGLRDLPWTPGREFEVVTVSIDPTETPTLARLKKQNYLEEYARAGRCGRLALPDRTRGEHHGGSPTRSGSGTATSPSAASTRTPRRSSWSRPTGDWRRYLYGVVYQPKTVRLALTEAGEGKIGTTADQLLLYCFHYDAQEGRYVLAATQHHAVRWRNHGAGRGTLARGVVAPRGSQEIARAFRPPNVRALQPSRFWGRDVRARGCGRVDGVGAGEGEATCDS